MPWYGTRNVPHRLEVASVPIRVILGEPLRHAPADPPGAVESGREVEVLLTGAESVEGLLLEEVAARAGISLEGPEGSLLVVVNGRLVPPGARGAVRVHEGDQVEVELMLAGG